MSLHVTCGCGHRVEGSKEMAGKEHRCPKCQEAVTLPISRAAKNAKLATLWRVRTPLSILGLVFGIISLLAVWQRWSTDLSGVLAVIWAIVPPLWFMVEQVCMSRIYENVDENDFKRDWEIFKAERECARNFWVAVGAVIFALFLHQLDKGAH